MISLPPIFIWSFMNYNKRTPRQRSGHCGWSYLKTKNKKNPVNKWLHQPPQIRSNKTRYIYAVAELRAICCDLLTAIYIYTDPKYFGNRNCPFYQNPTLFSSSFQLPDPHSERWREVLRWARRAKPLVCIALVGKCSRDWELWGSLLWKCGYQGENHVLGWSRLH